MKFAVRFLLIALAAPLAWADELPAATPPEGMVLVPGGEFTMGRTKVTDDDSSGMRPLVLRDDRPVHAVSLGAYYIDTHEVTQAQYERFVKATGRRAPYHWPGGSAPDGKRDHPVHNVDWDDAKAYCEWRGRRLPTEAEWERATRGGLEGKDYPWGDDSPSRDQARYNTPAGPGSVGSFPPNAFGVHDMAGGVSEWCSDWFDRTYYETSPSKNPQGPSDDMYKVIRGGSWSDGPRRITVFFRNWVRPNQRTPNIGFRCVKDVK